MVTESQLERIVEYLQGTCNTLDSAIQEITEDNNLDSNCLTGEQLDYIDNEIFLCDTCGWWYEICDKGEDSENCLDCTEE